MEPESTKFKVFSLNVWGLYVSKNRKERLSYLSNYLNQPEQDYSAVSLQELWVQSDYLRLKDSLSESYPYSHYYKSGVIGSGLAVFSRVPIRRVAFHRYALAGSPGRFWHGDWYAGKGVALAQLDLGSTLVDLFLTHTHADYGIGHQGYLAERVSHVWELLNFVQAQCDPMAFVVITGDFNTEQHDLPYRLLKDSPLNDSMTTDEVDTINVPGNSYTSGGEKTKRIDYIFHLPRAGVNCDHGCVLSDRLLPEQRISISDHQPLTATFTLTPSLWQPMMMRREVWSPAMLEREALLEKFVEIFGRQRHFTLQWQRIYIGANVTLTLVFIGLNIAMGVLINSVNEAWFTAVALVLFGLTPVVLLLSILGLLYAVVYLREELLKIDAYLEEWGQWLCYNQLQKAVKVNLDDALHSAVPSNIIAR